MLKTENVFSKINVLTKVSTEIICFRQTKTKMPLQKQGNSVWFKKNSLWKILGIPRAFVFLSPKWNQKKRLTTKIETCGKDPSLYVANYSVCDLSNLSVWKKNTILVFRKKISYVKAKKLLHVILSIYVKNWKCFLENQRINKGFDRNYLLSTNKDENAFTKTR